MVCETLRGVVRGTESNIKRGVMFLCPDVMGWCEEDVGVSDSLDPCYGASSLLKKPPSHSRTSLRVVLVFHPLYELVQAGHLKSPMSPLDSSLIHVY